MPYVREVGFYLAMGGLALFVAIINLGSYREYTRKGLPVNGLRVIFLVFFAMAIGCAILALAATVRWVTS